MHRLVFPLRCAPYVRPSGRFALRELARREGIGRYALRESGVTVHLRHPYVDLWVLYEIYDLLAHALPSQARRRLASLGRPPRILDVGSHVGLASAFFLGELPGAHITSLEPDPDNREVLLRTVADNRDRAGSWTVLPVAAATAPGTADFVSDRHLSRLGHSDHPATTAVTVELVDIFDHLAGVDLMKLDIEGGEWEILRDPRFAEGPKATVLSLEYHANGAPPGDPLSHATDLLRRAGYEIGPLRHVHAQGGTLWAWQAEPA